MFNEWNVRNMMVYVQRDNFGVIVVLSAINEYEGKWSRGGLCPECQVTFFRNRLYCTFPVADKDEFPLLWISQETVAWNFEPFGDLDQCRSHIFLLSYRIAPRDFHAVSELITRYFFNPDFHLGDFNRATWIRPIAELCRCLFLLALSCGRKTCPPICYVRYVSLTQSTFCRWYDVCGLWIGGDWKHA